MKKGFDEEDLGGVKTGKGLRKYVVLLLTTDKNVLEDLK